MKRSLAVLAIPLAALSLVACGDDDDDNDSGTTPSTEADGTDATEPDATDAGDDTLPGGITVPSLPGDLTIPSLPDAEDIEQQVIDSFTQLGMTEEQAQCLVDRIDLSSGEVPDLSNIMDLLGECDIDLTDLNPDG